MFKLKDYIFMPEDAGNFFRKLFLSVKNSTRRDKVGGAFFFIIALGLFYFANFTLEGIFFWLFFFVLVFWNLDSRISIGAALVGLVIIPILLALANRNILPVGEAWAEQVAVWVYFFLVIGVVKQIIEFKIENRKSKK
ncbi:MAG: hypothetical protein M0P97_00835 [Candidatus Moranbacteria bacterium]|jgi:hypothetical protein|nr:hypothetical protein [Candidatus Moranbacteria bacterium]